MLDKVMPPETTDRTDGDDADAAEREAAPRLGLVRRIWPHRLTSRIVLLNLLGLIVLPLRGLARVVAALAAAAGYAMLAGTWLPAPLRIGYAVTSTIPGAVPIGAALALALLGGIWMHAADRDD